MRPLAAVLWWSFAAFGCGGATGHGTAGNDPRPKEHVREIPAARKATEHEPPVESWSPIHVRGGASWRVRGSVFGGLLSGLKVTAPEGWSFMDPGEIDRHGPGETFEMGLRHGATGTELRFGGRPIAPTYRIAFLRHLLAQEPRAPEPHRGTLTVHGHRVPLFRSPGPSHVVLLGAHCTETQCAHFRIEYPEASAGAVGRFDASDLPSIDWLTPEERRALRTSLDGDPHHDIGLTHAVRDGAYYDFSGGIAIPAGAWRFDVVGPDRVRMVHRDVGTIGLLDTGYPGDGQHPAPWEDKELHREARRHFFADRGDPPHDGSVTHRGWRISPGPVDVDGPRVLLATRPNGNRALVWRLTTWVEEAPVLEEIAKEALRRAELLEPTRGPLLRDDTRFVDLRFGMALEIPRAGTWSITSENGEGAVEHRFRQNDQDIRWIAVAVGPEQTALDVSRSLLAVETQREGREPTNLGTALLGPLQARHLAWPGRDGHGRSLYLAAGDDVLYALSVRGLHIEEVAATFRLTAPRLLPDRMPPP
ncbi:MAG: hypothetical protein KC416_00670 [Myxococcales bacterium]|nr:hypothetical protein [Myxococcales bacterium]